MSHTTKGVSLLSANKLSTNGKGLPSELKTDNTIQMHEKPMHYEYEVALDGFTKKHAELVLLGNVLLVEAHKKEKKDEYCFKSVIQLPEEGDTHKIKASFKKGILSILVPKLRHSKLKAVHIPVN